VINGRDARATLFSSEIRGITKNSKDIARGARILSPSRAKFKQIFPQLKQGRAELNQSTGQLKRSKAELKLICAEVKLICAEVKLIPAEFQRSYERLKSGCAELT